MPETMMTVSDAIVQCLLAEGVERVFGYPGVTICPFYDSLAASSIQSVIVRQEQNAAHAAGAAARTTGKPGVCAVTSGPGATNLITGLATAYMDSVPLVAFTGQVDSHLLGRDVFQEADITGAAEPFVKHSYLVKEAAAVPHIVKEAFYLAATGRPGPVLIDLPVDIQKEKIAFAYPKAIDIPGYRLPGEADATAIRTAVAMINEAKRPLFCIGGGIHIAGAGANLQALVEKTGIPAVATMMGIGALPTAHPHYFGMYGIHGKPYANWALKNADLLILAGSRVGDRSVSPQGAAGKTTKVIHIDIDPAEVGKNLKVTLPLVGDGKAVLAQLEKAARYIRCDTANWLAELTAQKAKYTPDFDERKGTVNPKAFCRRLSLALPDNAIWVSDVGQNQTWSANNLLMRAGGRFLTSGGMGTMGYAIPAALGAKLADQKGQNRRVVAVCGDGAFQMSMMELATAVQYEAPFGVVVMTNHALGLVREHQDTAFDRRHAAVALWGPDTIKIAEAYGIPARRVTNMAEADAAIAEMGKADRLFLIEVMVDENESSL